MHSLFTADQIAQRVDALADSIADTLPMNFMMIGVLKGSFIFMADLARALDRRGAKPDIDFIRLSSYGQGRISTGDVQVIGDVPANDAGRPVLLVDDVADTGRSLVRARELIEGAGTEQIWTCTLVDKPGSREIDCAVDFVGFRVEDVFVVGYGIDHGEEYRSLPYLGYVA